MISIPNKKTALPESFIFKLSISPALTSRLVYPVELGTVWMVNREGRHVGIFEKFSTARLTLTCKILYPADVGPDSPPLPLC